MKRSPVRNAVEYGAFRVLELVVAVLPERLALGFGAFLGWITGSVLRIRRSVVDEHLRMAFPDESDAWRKRIARESYLHLGRETAAIFKLSRLSADELRARTTMVGYDVFEEAMARGKGVILMTGHLGNWEIGAAGFTTREVPFYAVAKGMQNSLFGRALLRARAGVGMGVIDMDEAAGDVLDGLRKGHAIAILADQNAHRGGIFVPFFGKLAATARGPAVFALRSGATMLMAIPLRDPGKKPTYTVYIEPVDFERTGDRDGDVRALTLAHTAALERTVRRAPEQYFWQHKRWKKRPKGEVQA